MKLNVEISKKIGLPNYGSSSVVTPLHGLSGSSFWETYHALTPQVQELAQGELWLDNYFCGWTPGPDTGKQIVVVPPPWSPPVVPPLPVIPELPMWAMFAIGMVMIGWHRRRFSSTDRFLT